MEMIHKLVLAFFIAMAVPALIDFIIYSVKSAPKNSTLAVKWWFVGFVCSIYVLYRLLP